MKIDPEITRLLKENTRRTLLENSVAQNTFSTVLDDRNSWIFDYGKENELVAKPSFKISWVLDMKKDKSGIHDISVAIRDFNVEFEVQNLMGLPQRKETVNVVDFFSPQNGWNLVVDYLSDKKAFLVASVELHYDRKDAVVTVYTF